MQFAHAIVVVLVAAALAGCVAGDDPGPSTTETGAPSATFSEDTGGIEGVVTDEELRPLEGAQVGVEGLAHATTTDAAGQFALDNVPAGEHVVLVGTIGYEPAAKRVTVTSGDVVPAEFRLAAVSFTEPFSQVYQFTGFITCSVGYAVVLSEECGAGARTPAGRYATDPNNQIDWRFDVEDHPELEQLRWMYVELDWKPASAAASQLGLHVAHGFTCEPSCDEDVNFCDVFENYGPPVVDCAVNVAGLELDPAEDLPYDITARAWAAPSGAAEPPNVVLQQSFTMYRTDFYAQDVPEGYSAVPES